MLAEYFREEGFRRLTAAVPEMPFVLTTTNKPALDALVGPTDALEIIGKPFDLDQLVAAVRRALARRDAANRLASASP